MPTYDFECLTERGGCGNKTELLCTLAERERLQKEPNKCSKCGKPLHQLPGTFGQPGWSTSMGIQT